MPQFYAIFSALEVRTLWCLLVCDILAQQHQFILNDRTLLFDIGLKDLALFELFENQCVLLSPIALPGQ